jgi:hypothetical protein
MSILNLKWTKGAPEFLLPGMVVRIPCVTPNKTVMFLAGTITSTAARKTVMASAIEWAQAIDLYELDWLNDMGVPAKVAV